MFPASSRHQSESSSNPLARMRRERRVALIIFNGLLLLAACIQLLGLALHPPAPYSGDAAPAISTGWDE